MSARSAIAMRTTRSLSVPRAAFAPEMTRRLPSLIGSPSAISTQPNSSASHASEALPPPVSPPSVPPPSSSSAHAAAINMRANRSDNRDNHFDLLMNPPYSTDEPPSGHRPPPTAPNGRDGHEPRRSAAYLTEATT